MAGTTTNRRPALPMHIGVLLAALLLSLWAYRPGLTGDFVFDDLPNIVLNDRIAAVHGVDLGKELSQAAFSMQTNLLQRPVSMLSFALNHYAAGMSPFWFKLTNLLLHLLNGALVYWLCRRVIEHLPAQMAPSRRSYPSSQIAAACVAAIWVLHPMNLSSVLYVVQRMNELATLFTLLGLICYVEGRQRSLSGERGLAAGMAGLVLFGVLATFSKENGALIVAYAFVIELVCFRFATLPMHRRAVHAFFGLTLLLPLLLLATYIATHPGLAERLYWGREFTLEHRLLSEGRILWRYLAAIAVPLPSSLGLFHDDIAISISSLAPATTLPALLGVVIALGFALWKYKTWPVFAIAVLWFAAGHSMESTVLPLELAFEHRNYLPMLGPILAIVLFLARWTSAWRPSAAAAVFAVPLLTFTALTHSRANEWRDPLTLAISEAEHHPGSARANYEAGREIVVAGERNGTLLDAALRARPYFEQGMKANPHHALSAAGLLLTYSGTPSIPGPLVDELTSRIRTMAGVRASTVLGVMRAQNNGKLALTPDQVTALLGAVLENPNASSLQKALALNELGRFHLEQLYDAQSAVSFTLAAAKQDPTNPLFRVNVANLALTLKRPDIAEASAREAERLDPRGLYAASIAEIRTTIAALR